MLKHAFNGLIAILLLWPGRVVLSQELPAFATSCASCHQMSIEDDAENGQAPPLYYAGNKFQSVWLERWLQAPTRIRPAGGFFADHLISNEEGDTIDVESLQDHIAVDQDTAKQLTEWLMSLRPNDELIAESSDYTPAPISPRLGAMDFVKFKGCGGCHRDTPEYGGLSGPELYTAWDRLQPEFIVSYIKNPRAWYGNSSMPDRDLGDEQIHKLANYIKTLIPEE